MMPLLRDSPLYIYLQTKIQIPYQRIKDHILALVPASLYSILFYSLSVSQRYLLEARISSQVIKPLRSLCLAYVFLLLEPSFSSTPFLCPIDTNSSLKIQFKDKRSFSWKSFCTFPSPFQDINASFLWIQYNSINIYGIYSLPRTVLRVGESQVNKLQYLPSKTLFQKKRHINT